MVVYFDVSVSVRWFGEKPVHRGQRRKGEGVIFMASVGCRMRITIVRVVVE